ncbi:polysaccharide pyruvyl transferase family protein [Leucobacter zeae]|nr:polysaccharide pyruvyl transferase family protein [Leucobacter zeae]
MEFGLPRRTRPRNGVQDGMATRRILIRAGRPPHDTTSNEGAVAWGPWGHFAGNAGNMVFSDSVYETLNVPGAEITCDAYAPERYDLTQRDADEVNERYDVYAIPLANAFRNDYAEGPLVRLTSFIEKLRIPVVVVGVGGQGAIGKGAAGLSPRAQENVRRFVAAVLERSHSIGLRGESTRGMLAELGFSEPDVDVIGCPSLYRMGRDFAVERRVERITADSPLAVNLESKLPIAADFYRANEAAYSDLVSVFQTLYGAELLLWGTEMPRAFTAGTPTSISHPAYREGRIRFFTNPRSWRDFLADRDFSFGTRIHGNITALTAGTPAFVLTTDLRTQELVDYHGIPHARFDETVRSGRYLAADLYERADYADFNARMPGNWDHYHAFLESNGLAHIHEEGNAHPEYATRLADAAATPGIVPVSAAHTPEIATRLSWLWQGRAADRDRPTGGYRPEFPLDRTDAQSLRQQLDRVTGQLAEQRAANAELEARLDARLAELEAFKSYLNRPVGARVRSAIARRLPGGRG